MKKILLIALMLLPLVASADPVEVDGLNYLLNEEEKTAMVTLSNYNGILVIPESINVEGVDYIVTSIDEYAFRENNNLLSVTIPTSVKTMGVAAFTYCNSLIKVNLGNGLETIGHRAFSYCSNLQSVFFGTSVNKLDDSVFNGCTNLSQIYIKDLSQWCKIDFMAEGSNPLTYAHHLYLDKKELKDLIIPEGIETIKQYAFCGCTSLETVKLPKSLKSIAKFAFKGCTSIEELEIPEGITTINEYAFNGCSKLEKVKLPESLQIIEYCAFCDCLGLRSITIPANVEYFNYYSFYSSTNEEVDFFIYPEYPPFACKESFPSNSIFYVPEGSIELYKNVAPWSNLNVKTFTGLGSEKCTPPVITYKNETISFTSETPDAVFHYVITSADGQKNTGSSLNVSGKLLVRVYASKSGYEDSDIVESEIDIKGIKGDVDGDGVVNVADHVKLSDIIINNE